jgi:hypothetical protein
MSEVQNQDVFERINENLAGINETLSNIYNLIGVGGMVKSLVVNITTSLEKIAEAFDINQLTGVTAEFTRELSDIGSILNSIANSVDRLGNY